MKYLYKTTTYKRKQPNGEETELKETTFFPYPELRALTLLNVTLNIINWIKKILGI